MSTKPDSTPGARKNARARELFLEAFERTGMVSTAAREAGVPRRTVYNWRGEFEGFARAWDEVVERSTEIMERAAFQRAVVGTKRPVFQGGELVGHVSEFSDTLLIFMLKARRPDVYRDRHTVEHTGSVEQRVKLDLSQLTNEQLVALEAIQPDGDIADRTDAG